MLPRFLHICSAILIEPDAPRYPGLTLHLFRFEKSQSNPDTNPEIHQVRFPILKGTIESETLTALT